jgi:hypothetical protein
MSVFLSGRCPETRINKGPKMTESLDRGCCHPRQGPFLPKPHKSTFQPFRVPAGALTPIKQPAIP